MRRLVYTKTGESNNAERKEIFESFVSPNIYVHPDSLDKYEHWKEILVKIGGRSATVPHYTHLLKAVFFSICKSCVLSGDNIM